MTKRKPVDPAKWARLGRMAKELLDEIDVYAIAEAAGDQIWLSMRRWGRPDDRFAHDLRCPCADCT
jgi:hypothetical protein